MGGGAPKVQAPAGGVHAHGLLLLHPGSPCGGVRHLGRLVEGSLSNAENNSILLLQFQTVEELKQAYIFIFACHLGGLVEGSVQYYGVARVTPLSSYFHPWMLIKSAILAACARFPSDDRKGTICGLIELGLCLHVLSACHMADCGDEGF